MLRVIHSKLPKGLIWNKILPLFGTHMFIVCTVNDNTPRAMELNERLSISKDGQCHSQIYFTIQVRWLGCSDTVRALNGIVETSEMTALKLANDAEHRKPVRISFSRCGRF